MLARNLASCRAALHLSQRELSQASGVSRNQLSKIESGEIWPSLTTVLSLCHTLSVEPSSLFREPSREREERFEELRYLVLKIVYEDAGFNSVSHSRQESKAYGSLIARNLKYYRAREKLSQRDLAEKAGLSVRLLSDIETGRAWPLYGNLLAICEALSVIPLMVVTEIDREKEERCAAIMRILRRALR